LAARSNEPDGCLTDSAVTEGDDHGQPAAEECADVGDVATDEVDHHDGQDERQPEQEGGDADDNGHDGGHDGAAPPVVTQDSDGIPDEAVELVPEPGVDLGDEGTPQPRAVLEQVVRDQGGQDHAAGQADQRADTRNEMGEEAVRDHRGGRLGRCPSRVQGGLVDAERVDQVAQRCVDGGTDLIRLLGHPPDGGDHDAGHQGE
jgi:hypothetical protein